VFNSEEEEPWIGRETVGRNCGEELWGGTVGRKKCERDSFLIVPQFLTSSFPNNPPIYLFLCLNN